MLRSEPVVVAETGDMPRDEWLELRRSGLGGSDAAPAVGLSRWKTPLEVWLDKTGRLPEREPSERMLFGQKLESVVADEFAERTGLHVEHRPVLLRHPDHPWMLANPDRFVGDDGILECKTTDLRNAEDWADGPPREAALQGNHYLAVCGRQVLWIAVLIGGNRFEHFRLERDEGLIEMLIALEGGFWNNNVLADVEPPAMARDTEVLRDRYATGAAESEIILPPEAAELIAERQRLRAEQKACEAEADEIDNRLKQMLGPNEIGIDVHGDPLITWKTSWPVRLDEARLKADRPALVAKYSMRRPQRRIHIPKKKENPR